MFIKVSWFIQMLAFHEIKKCLMRIGAVTALLPIFFFLKVTKFTVTIDTIVLKSVHLSFPTGN